MSADDLLGLQFEHFPSTDGGHELTAFHPVHGEVGYMNWYGHKGGPDAAPGEVSMVMTWQPHRRKGVATQLWNEAQQYDPPPVHSSNRTPLGAKWARAVGGAGI